MPKPADQKLTDKHFKIFAAAVRKWAVHLGLQGWAVSIEWTNSDDALAKVFCNPEGRRADVVLARSWPGDDYKPTPEFLEKVAFHELMHVVLADLSLAAGRGTPPTGHSALDAVEHTVIRTVENLIFPPK